MKEQLKKRIKKLQGDLKILDGKWDYLDEYRGLPSSKSDELKKEVVDKMVNKAKEIEDLERLLKVLEELE